MSLLKEVTMKNLLGEEVVEVHPFETCSECKREIDNGLEGFYGNALIPELVLCQQCYEKITQAGNWEAERVRIKGKWVS